MQYINASHIILGIINPLDQDNIRNSELISDLYAEKIWKFIKILFFHENIFFLIRKRNTKLHHFQFKVSHIITATNLLFPF
jgi:hypothetical protein